MKKGDLVHCKSMPNISGLIIRVSEKGQWADVDWFSHSKRLGLQYLEQHAFKVNEFLVDGIIYREVFRNVGTDNEERGGCCQLDGSNMTECEGCRYEYCCPADGDVDE